MYHRVADLPDYVHPIAVSPNHFAQHLDYLRCACRPMRLFDLVAALRGGRLPKRAVAVTFDDGYVDNLTDAYPLLKQAQIPATVFVSAAHVNSPCEYWWDELERLLLFSHPSGSTLQLTIGGTTQEWPVSSRAERESTRQALHQLLRPLRATERHAILVELRRWAGLAGAARPGFRPMNTSELAQLLRSGLVDLGAHTLSHPVLPALSPREQLTEIVRSREQLEVATGSPALTFAYPYGDYTPETVSIVKDAGFIAACTSDFGSVDAADDPFRLPRYHVADWDCETFARILENLI